jgi:hypothetical protein
MFLKDVGSAKDLLRCRSALFLKNINFLTVEDQLEISNATKLHFGIEFFSSTEDNFAS